MPNMSQNGAITYRDVAAHLDNKNKSKLFIDLLCTRSDVFEDVQNIPCNEGRSHVVHYRTGLPKATWTHLYGGVESSKGSQATSRITVAEIESKLELDKRLLERYSEVNEVLRREVAGHVDAITLNYVKAMLYGSKKLNPDSFNGLATIYDACGGTNPYEIAFNCISAGGASTDSLGSLFLVGHGTEGFCNLYPQGHKTAGVEVSPMTEEEVTEVSAPTKSYRGLIQHFSMSGAPFVADWRKCGRYCNIARNQTFQTQADLVEAANEFFTGLGRLTTRVDDKGVRQCFYADKGVWEQIKVFAAAITRTNAIKEEDLKDHKVLTLNGIPVRINDAQYVDEDVVQ